MTHREAGGRRPRDNRNHRAVSRRGGTRPNPKEGKVTALVVSDGSGFPIADGPAHGIGAPAQTGAAAR
ncbi:hypothetical protein Srubr_80080 [Streptomyces rubradiris]|uniref:Uncharacterized protein n=1 Tax=Streptomyces rubradiris TaxID=285531 RepID=A0ABQ3RQN4_STRRR|nr:hypothetical protein GCM10018792_77610 [Streptomyces rubradiris]GHI58162.1 hypothetical protein Srubr_80080 [Streptomyces rubradiris]